MVAGGRRKRIPNSGALYHPFGLVTHGEGCWRGTRSRRFRRQTMSGSVRCPTAGLVRTRQRKPPFRAICRAGSVAEDSEHGSDPALLSHRSFAWAATSEAFPGDRGRPRPLATGPITGRPSGDLPGRRDGGPRIRSRLQPRTVGCGRPAGVEGRLSGWSSRGRVSGSVSVQLATLCRIPAPRLGGWAGLVAVLRRYENAWIGRLRGGEHGRA